MLRKQIITSYKYEFRSSEPENVAILYLYHYDKAICMAIFTAEDYLPPPREGINGIVYIAYRCDWLQGLVEMLRHEEPVHFTWDDTDQIARITTDEEPVGDEERKSLFRYVFGD